jgi:hypothetical protein
VEVSHRGLLAPLPLPGEPRLVHELLGMFEAPHAKTISLAPLPLPGGGSRPGCDLHGRDYRRTLSCGDLPACGDQGSWRQLARPPSLLWPQRVQQRASCGDFPASKHNAKPARLHDPSIKVLVLVETSRRVETASSATFNPFPLWLVENKAGSCGDLPAPRCFG